ncbi:MAG: aldo/keto reductase [Chitinivibrionales bacterium]|nr:aldo/keto reductase [Chitinivibrionales bacterium]MBD3358019.1 aldo/keto reductase [Chitinivibrionales bacterium]
MDLEITGRAVLNNGVEMPRLGLGVFKAEYGEETRRAVRWALEAGYRHIDTAKVYGNEPSVGEAVVESGIPRDQVFITTKVWNNDQGYDKTLKAYEASLKRLGMDYIDLYLIHWPVKGKRLDTWRALERLLKEGRCRAVGVSNFMPHHMNELLDKSETVPAVNQVEFSPFMYRKELLELCRSVGTVLEAYSPLTRGRRLDDPTIGAIAAKHGKTAAQVIIRWVLQHKVIVIPKSVHKERIEENADVFDFELSTEEMVTLDGLDEHYTILSAGWIPEEWE